tara:strand:- start:7898 stop:8398 length:501 start_codon:yes stop_codon:yes gene_type:complete
MDTVKKVRKRRKSMTPEQRKEASERLKVARAKKKPTELKSIAKSVLNLDEDDELSYQSVKRYIDTQTKINTYLKKQVRENVRHANSKLNTNNTYLSQLKSYLRDGIWTSLFVGEYMDILLKQPQHWDEEEYEEVRIFMGGRWSHGYRLIKEPNSICFYGRDIREND